MSDRKLSREHYSQYWWESASSALMETDSLYGNCWQKFAASCLGIRQGRVIITLKPRVITKTGSL